MKFLLIVLVVFDHSLEEISLEHNYAIIRAWIYSFHMPAFIFISGYFSKHVRKNGGVRKTIINCAIPYFIFNTIFVLWTEKTLAINILTPRYIFGDLFSLLIWRLLIDDLKGIRGILILSIILGLYIGGIHTADRFLAIFRTIVFFLYFLLGALTDEEAIVKIRKMPKLCSVIMVVILSLCVIVLHIKNIIPVKAYENIQCYQKSGMSNLQGDGIRLLSYGIGIAAVICIINLISNEKKCYTAYGSRAASIYIASAFSVIILYEFIDNIWSTNFLLNHIEVGILLSLCVTVITIFAFGNKKISNIYLNVNKKIGDALMKSEGENQQANNTKLYF